MINIKSNIIHRLYVACIIVLFSATYVFQTQYVTAAVLPPGTVNTCGELAAPGTYTLGSNVSTTSSSVTCFTISSNGVVLDGAGQYWVFGKIVADGISSPGFNFTLQNITATSSITANGVTGTNGTSGGAITIASSTVSTVTSTGGDGGFTAGNAGGNGGAITISNSTTTVITANGGKGYTSGTGGIVNVSNSTTTTITAGTTNGSKGSAVTNSGSGGTITIASSTFGALTATGGSGSNAGSGGIITISGSDLNLSGLTITNAAGIGTVTAATNGTTSISYTTISTTTTTLSALSSLSINSVDYGPFVGGAFPSLFPGTVITSAAQCIINLRGTYTLGANINGNCTIKSSGTVLDGLGLYTIAGNVIGDGFAGFGNGFDYTLKNITATGTVSSNAYLDTLITTTHGGAITIQNSNINLVTSIGYDALANVMGGIGGTVNVSSSTITSINVSGGASTPQSGGIAGTIIITNSTVATSTANGGAGGIVAGKVGGAGGIITVSNSTTTVVVANGGAGMAIASSTGGIGGRVTIATSTTGAITTNGGDGATHGGMGGVIAITNSYEIASSTAITANGGSVIVCGYGGGGGSVSLINSTYSIVSNGPGSDYTAIGVGHCASPPSGSSGSSGSQSVVGTYTPPSSSNNSNQNQNNPNANTNQIQSSVSVTTGTYIAPIFIPNTVNTVIIPVNNLQLLKLKDLPTFGEGKDSFSLKSPITSFLFTPLPESLTKELGVNKKLLNFIKFSGVNYEKDLFTIQKKPLAIEATTTIPGIFIVKSVKKTLESYLSFDSINKLSQTIKVEPNVAIDISIIPTSDDKVMTNFQNQSILFKSSGGLLTTNITTPSERGVYVFKSTLSPIPLLIEVIPPVKQESKNIINQSTSLLKKFVSWFQNLFK